MSKWTISVVVVLVIVASGESLPNPNSGGYYYPVPKIPFRYPNELDDDDLYAAPRRERPRSRPEYSAPRRETSLPRREPTGTPRREEPRRSRTRPEDSREKDPKETPRRMSRLPEERNPEPETEVPRRTGPGPGSRTITTTITNSTDPVAPEPGRKVTMTTVTTQEEAAKRTTTPGARRRVVEEITREEVLNRGPEAVAGNRTQTMVINRQNGGREFVTEEITVVPNNRGRVNSNGIITTMTTEERRGGTTSTVRRGQQQDSISDIINSERSGGSAFTRTTTREGRDEIYVRRADGTMRKIDESELEDILNSLKTSRRMIKTTVIQSGRSTSSTTSTGGGSSLSSNIDSTISMARTGGTASYPQDDDAATAGSSAEEILVRYQNADNQDNRAYRDRDFDFAPSDIAFRRRDFLLNASPEEIASRTGAHLINF